MSLSDEINQARLQVHTDSYPMSIGEMVNLYRDGDLDIHPEFQRVYRWTEEQKSKLIESILLGIPLPSFFVSQRQDGVWDVVDGLQRLSTIFSFLGELKKTDGTQAKPLELRSTKYLPSLEGKVWDDPHNPDREVDIEIKRVFKREKLDIKIIKRESESDTKFELFQRLNTGGSKLSDQEVRNCMLLMLNVDGFEWLQTIAKNKDFIATTPLSDKQELECYAQELAFRLIVQRHYDEELRKKHTDVGPYLNAELNRIFSQEKPIINYEYEKIIFEKTFELFNLALEDSSFKKYNHQKKRLEGAISIPVYEALATALSFYIENNQDIELDKTKEMIIRASYSLTETKEFLDVMDKSVRPLDRMIAMISVGKELIK
ncbi:TPA: DUF262 domain-containing protein [Yersinia enterocolitica]|nr:DUF262 domain-containing protein [Yersinia enterocolitica]